MKVLENNYRPILLRKRCEHCDSLIEIDYQRDVMREDCFLPNDLRPDGKPSKNGVWHCPCCRGENIIKDLYA